MYKVIRLSKYYLNELRKLNSNRELFNKCNDDFFSIYDTSSFASQIFIRRRVRLLLKDDVVLGYVWIEPFDKDINKIKSLYVEGDYNDASICEAYEFLLDTLPKKKCYIYNCLQNKINEKLLKYLLFSVKDSTISLIKSIDSYDENFKLDSINSEGIYTRTFMRDKDEELRCRIQNDIFKSNKRIPLSVDDIYFDEAQDYYMNDCALFLYYNDQCIGYGQLMLDHNIPLIVNFGIIEEYRGKGFSKVLLSKLLNKASMLDYKECLIRVSSNNDKALNLYKSFGFKVYEEAAEYYYFT